MREEDHWRHTLIVWLCEIHNGISCQRNLSRRDVLEHHRCFYRLLTAELMYPQMELAKKCS